MNFTWRDVLLAIVFAGVVLASGAIVLMSIGERKLFNARLWNNATEVQIDDGVLRRMARDLVVSDRLIGLTEPEVVSLLGPAIPDPLYFGEADLVYWTGPDGSLFDIDSSWLVVQLGGDEAVVEVKQAFDKGMT